MTQHTATDGPRRSAERATARPAALRSGWWVAARAGPAPSGVADRRRGAAGRWPWCAGRRRRQEPPRDRDHRAGTPVRCGRGHQPVLRHRRPARARTGGGLAAQPGGPGRDRTPTRGGATRSTAWRPPGRAGRARCPGHGPWSTPGSATASSRGWPGRTCDMPRARPARQEVREESPTPDGNRPGARSPS